MKTPPGAGPSEAAGGPSVLSKEEKEKQENPIQITRKPSWKPPGASWELLGASRGLLGASWELTALLQVDKERAPGDPNRLCTENLGKTPQKI